MGLGNPKSDLLSTVSLSSWDWDRWFFAEGKKREENRKDPPRKDRNQPQSQFVGDARFGEASALKNGLS